jgi:hypothetical protein
VAGGAHLRVLALEPRAIESRTVRIKPPPAPGGVTGKTIPLGVTPDATLQALSCCLTMADQKELLGVMKSRAQDALRNQP